MDFNEAADELYGLPPSEFTSRRDALATDARKSGDKDLADLVKRLRRPTVGAWLVNALSRQQTEGMQRLIDLGETMRTAQRNLAGDELKDLSRQRQSLISELARDAKRIASSYGQPANDSALQDLTRTLDAAVADSDAAEEVKGGRLTAALQYSGFGDFGPSDLPARAVVDKDAKRGTQKAPNKATVTASEADTSSLDNARRVLKEAEATKVALERDVRSKESALDRADDECGRLGERVAELDKQLSKLREARRKAESGRIAAQKELEAARLRLHQSEKAATRASSSVNRITSKKRG
ncbi:MAG: hypothetical protein WAM97_22875 [Acidimicrobiales bacterium]|jgi:hypothetical protein